MSKNVEKCGKIVLVGSLAGMIYKKPEDVPGMFNGMSPKCFKGLQRPPKAFKGLLQLSGKLTQVIMVKQQKNIIYMSLKPSNMTSMQFLTITVDLIIKFRVDPYSRHRFLTFLSKIVKNRYKTILLASRSHQK